METGREREIGRERERDVEREQGRERERWRECVGGGSCYLPLHCFMLTRTSSSSSQHQWSAELLHFLNGRTFIMITNPNRTHAFLHQQRVWTDSPGCHDADDFLCKRLRRTSAKLHKHCHAEVHSASKINESLKKQELKKKKKVNDQYEVTLCENVTQH